MLATSIQQHAIDRYMQRSGSKKLERTIGKIFRISDGAVPIGGNLYYSKGWIIVVVSGVIKTTYRPKTRAEMNAIHSAMKKCEKKP